MIATAPSILIGSKTKSQEYFSSLRWPAAKRCPACSIDGRLYLLSDERYKCGACGHRFSEFSGSYLAHLYIPLEETAHLLYLFTMGIPAFKAKQYLRTSLKTAHRAYRLFRKAIYESSLADIESVEARSAVHDFTKWPRYRNTYVIGIREHTGRVTCFPVSDKKSEELVSHFDPTRDISDLAYVDASVAFVRFQIDSGFVTIEKKYTSNKKRSPTHDVAMEQFWNASLKWLYQFRGIPKTYFPHYLKEAEFRFNHKGDDMFAALASLIASPTIDTFRHALVTP